MRSLRATVSIVLLFAAFLIRSASAHAQAALLLEQPYGFFGAVNPTGHAAIYLERVCAATPVELRRCEPGEMGAVISRYDGIDGFDWIAIPLVPYLYSVEDASTVPERVDRAMVERMRDRYREAHLLDLGENLSGGNLVKGGWTELVGAAYERRIYAFRFDTTEAQDDALIAEMNAGPNRSHFELLYSNCADFARVTLNRYFPRTFRRSIFPDAGMTTPKQVTDKLVRYARKHPEEQLAVFEIPQIPGYRHLSRSNKSVAESLTTTAYAVPIALANPYIAGGLFVDYMVRGRAHLIPKHPQMLGPEDLSALTATAPRPENSVSAGAQAAGVAEASFVETNGGGPSHSGLKGMMATHE
jgi:hypothetical protein